MADTLLKAKAIIKEFGAPVPTRVLHGIDLSIECGEFCALIGNSGSGKSTLLNIIGALDRPSGGQVFIEGIDLAGLTDDELAFFRNQTMGFIFQFHFLLPQFTVLENVLIPHLIYRGKADKSARDRAMYLLEQVGLLHRRDYKANSISGGEQQRAAIARALMNQPRLILADEPTGNLDSKNSAHIFNLMRKINQENQTTFLIVTHDRNMAFSADRIIELKDGLIVRDECVCGQDPNQMLAVIEPLY